MSKIVIVKYTAMEAFKIPKGIDLENKSVVKDWGVKWNKLYITFIDGTEKVIEGENWVEDLDLKYPDEGRTTIEPAEDYGLEEENDVSDSDSDDGFDDCICEEDENGDTITNKDCPAHDCCKVCSQGKKCTFNDMAWLCADCQKEIDDEIDNYTDDDEGSTTNEEVDECFCDQWNCKICCPERPLVEWICPIYAAKLKAEEEEE